MNTIFRDTEGNTIDTPASRTFAVIKREVAADVSRRNSKPTIASHKDRNIARAIQYAAAMRGEESPHSRSIERDYSYSLQTRGGARWATAANGEKRIISIRGQKIPHWDFVAEIETLSTTPAPEEHYGVLA